MGGGAGRSWGGGGLGWDGGGLGVRAGALGEALPRNDRQQVADVPVYASRDFDKEVRCSRAIGAASPEKFVVDAPIELLTSLDLSGSPATVTLTSREKEAIAAEEQELAELKDAVDGRDSLEGRCSRAPDVLAGLVGEHPRDRKNELVAREDCERMNAVLRFLFSAVIIDEYRGPSNKFDYSRIEIEPNPLQKSSDTTNRPGPT